MEGLTIGAMQNWLWLILYRNDDFVTFARWCLYSAEMWVYSMCRNNGLRRNMPEHAFLLKANAVRAAAVL